MPSKQRTLFAPTGLQRTWQEKRGLQGTWKQKRDRAIDKGRRNANPVWFATAYEAVKAVARDQREFIALDVIRQLRNSPNGNIYTHDLRALGGVMLKAAKMGVCEKTNRYVPNPERHGAPVVVWRSLMPRWRT
jgi:hypothetical protein